MVRDLLAPTHLLLIVAVFMLFFGGKKLADVGKGLGEGIRNFKTGLKGEDAPPPPATPDEKKQA
jgi:sec-independent protein translocase protein TatA